MGEVIKIDEKMRERLNLIKFDQYIKFDGFLELTAINALKANGYDVSEEGVKLAQSNLSFEESGIYDIQLLTMLIQIFEPERIQEILSHLDSRQRALDEWSDQSRGNISTGQAILILLWAVICVISFFVGAYTIFHKLLLMIIGAIL